MARTLGPLERLALPRLADGKRMLLLPPLRIEGGALRTDGATLRTEGATLRTEGAALRLLPRLLPPPLRIEGMLRLIPPLLIRGPLLMRGPLLRIALPALRDMPPPERIALAPPLR